MATVPTVLTVTVGMKNRVVDYLTYIRDAISFFLNTPTVRVYNSAVINLATSATWVVLTFDTEEVDTDNCHSTVSNTSRLTATTAGRYLVTYMATFASNATGYRAVQVRKNAAASVVGGTGLPLDAAAPTTGAVTTISGTFTTLLAATDYLELFAVQTSGGALNVAFGQWVTSFEMKYVGTT